MTARGVQRGGFTLLELLVAMALLVTAMSIIVGTFVTVLKSWQRGTALLDDLHHGDFVMNQLVSGLRSAAYFPSAGGTYGFRLEDHGGRGYAEDSISWVTSSSAFLPRDSVLNRGLHRISITIEENDDGDTAVAVRAYPHMATDMEDDDVDPWYVSTEVKGLDCQWYDQESDTWEDDWEKTNEIPAVVSIVLTMEPLEEYGDPVELKRVIPIPLGGQEAANQDRAKGKDNP